MALSGPERAAAALLTLALAAALALLLTAYFLAHGPGPGALELTRVEGAVQPAAPFEAPTADAAPDLPATPWQAVALPHTWPRAIVPTDASLRRSAEVHWFRAELPPPAADAAPRHLYIARWQTIGTLAIYADQRLIYRTQADLVWNGFNHPLLLPLDRPGEPPARTLHVRIAGQVGAGGALTTLWLGPEAALRPLHDARQHLQVRLPELGSAAVLGLAVFALGVWLRRRGERLYLLFSVYAVVLTLRGLHYHLGLAPLPVDSAWFGWVTVNTINVAFVIWYYVIVELVPQVTRWPARALVALTVAGAVATLPPLSGLPLAEALSALSYMTTIVAGFPAIVWLTWVCWRKGSRESIAATVPGLLDFVLAVHDTALMTYQLPPGHLYLFPMAALFRLLFFTYLLLQRYVGAIGAVERSNLVLAERLREREAELTASHDQLRAIQEREAVHRERQRLMQDLHDGMGAQLLSALRVAEAGHLDEQQMQAVLRECIDDLKLTVDSLEPVDTDLVLLLATLRYRLGPRLQRAGLQLDWQVGEVPPLPWLDARDALHILRILQEAFSNVLQHAGARHLRVATAVDGDGVAVLVDDDGRGPETTAPAGTAAPARSNGHGLANMASRARSLGGTVTWQAIEGGSRLRLWLPLQRPAT